MESAIWTLPIIILSWPVVILIINTIVLVVTKEPGQDTNGQVHMANKLDKIGVDVRVIFVVSSALLVNRNAIPG